jgi:hypothetical protein
MGELPGCHERSVRCQLTHLGAHVSFLLPAEAEDVNKWPAGTLPDPRVGLG